MIPTWKLRRELLRLTSQIVGLPATLIALPGRLREPARRAAYERNFDTVTQLDTGVVPFGKKPAIYLIYQPNGIAKSSLAALDWLTAHGYSPIVVSNSPLQEQDMSDILQRSSLLLRRPNFGYDFGGYKDGIKLINRQGITPERVIIMNDSVWLPMVPDLMERLEQRDDADILGLLEDEKVIHSKDGGRPSGLKHLQSYFYMINSTGWSNVYFQDFWRNYKMTNSKKETITKGEIGFSHIMRNFGLKIDSLSSRSEFYQEITQKKNDFLLNSLKYAAYDDKHLRLENAHLISNYENSEAWRLIAIEHIEKSIYRRTFCSTLPYANDQIFGTMFLKKNREELMIELRKQYIKAVTDKVVPRPPNALIGEISLALNKDAGHRI